jgi:hypothetical protein
VEEYIFASERALIAQIFLTEEEDLVHSCPGVLRTSLANNIPPGNLL